MLVYLRLDLEVGEVVDLPNVLSGDDVLPQFHVEQSQLTVYGRTHFKLVLALAHEQHVLAHVAQVVFHLRHLHVSVYAVLLQPLAYEPLFSHGEIVVFLALREHLLAYELLLVQA